MVDSHEKRHPLTVATYTVMAVCWAASHVEASTSAFPQVQAVPYPGPSCRFEVDGVERVCFRCDGQTPKPFLFPLIGPSGRRLTSMSHPVDPVGHRHHRSVWFGHRDVQGTNLWEEDGSARITGGTLLRFESGTDSAVSVFRHAWIGPGGNELVHEERTISLRTLPNGESLLELRFVLTPADQAITFGKTPYGFLGVRVAPTMAVQGGGGRILDSEGRKNEKEVHWQRSRWVDYSGPVTADEENGIALFDHPDNPRFPSFFHVRDDGWMCPAFCHEGAFDLPVEESLHLRYELYLHGHGCSAGAIQQRWEDFSRR